MQAALKLIELVQKARVLTEEIAHAAANASRRLCHLAADPSITEETLRPVVARAAECLDEILIMAEGQISRPIESSTVTELREALQGLRSFLPEASDEAREPTESTTHPGVYIPTTEDIQQAEQIAAWHTRIIMCVVLVLLVGFAVASVLTSKPELRKMQRDLQRTTTTHMLGIANDALNTLYDKMIAAGEDTRLSGRTVASVLLTEMCVPRSSGGVNWTIFVSGSSPLYEFRAGTQDFSNKARVTEMSTNRSYPLLCRKNASYPMYQINDVRHATPNTIPELTPFNCGDDSGAYGVFAGVMAGYASYSPYVLTYRRIPAHLSSVYHTGFSLSVAATVDDLTLQEFVATPNSLFRPANMLYTQYGRWKHNILMTIPLSIVVALGTVQVLMELLAVTRFRSKRFVFSTVITIVVGAAVAITHLLVRDALTVGIREMQIQHVNTIENGVVAAATSSKFREYNASKDFLTHVSRSSLSSNIFSIDSDGLDITPPSMSATAEQIDAAAFVDLRSARYSGYRNGYVFTSIYLTEAKRSIVAVFPAAKFPLATVSSVAMGVLAVVVCFVFLMVYLHYSPLGRLLDYSAGSPLLKHNIAGPNIRYVLYVVLSGLIVFTMSGLNCYAVEGLHRQLVAISSESLMILGATNRAPKVVDLCTSSCSLPNFLSALYFYKDANRTYSIDGKSPYPTAETPPDISWSDTYYAAQLALSHVSTVVENAISFATPLVNFSTGVGAPQSLQRRMVAAVDINGTHGFAIERLPSSYYPSSFAFVCHSIGFAIAICAVCQFLCVTEWKYLQLRVLHQQRRSLYRPYIIIALSAVLLSGSVLVHAGLMKYFIERFTRDFLTEEVSMLARSAKDRLEIVAVAAAKQSPSSVVPRLQETIANMSDAVSASVSSYSRWLLLQEHPSYGSGTVRIVQPDLGNDVIEVGDLSRGIIPVCRMNSAAHLEAGKPMKLIGCYSEILINRPADQPLEPRLFSMVVMDATRMSADPALVAWRMLMEESSGAAVALLLLSLLLIWWVMHGAHGHGYAVLDAKEMGRLRGPLLRNCRKIDEFLPRHIRMHWLAGLLLLGLVVTYYAASITSFHEAVADALNFVHPHTMQEYAVMLLGQRFLNALYQFFVLRSVATLDDLGGIGTELLQSKTDYVFTQEANRMQFVEGLNMMIAALVSAGEHGVLHDDDVLLVQEGFDTYQSAVAAKYAETVTIQRSLMNLFEQLHATAMGQMISISEADKPINTAVNIEFVHELLIAQDNIVKLFILDHVAVASLIDFSNDASYSMWPIGSAEEAEELATSVHEGMQSVWELIQKQLDILETLSADLIEGANVSSKVITDIGHLRASLPGSILLKEPTHTLWAYQKSRCNEIRVMHDKGDMRQKEASDVSLLEAAKKTLSMTNTASVREVNFRKTMQMLEYTKRGVSVSEEVPALEWQHHLSLIRTQLMATVALACTAVVYVVGVTTLAACFGLLRRRLGDELRSAPAMTPLIDKQRMMTSYEHQETVRPTTYVVIPFVLLSLVALVPIPVTYWLLTKSLSSTSGALLSNAMSGNIASVENRIVSDVQNLLSVTLSVYKTGDKNAVSSAFEALLASVNTFVNGYMWGVRRSDLEKGRNGATEDTENPIFSLDSLQELLDLPEELWNGFLNEYRAYENVVLPQDQTDYSKEQSSYALQIIKGLSGSNSYAILSPVSVTSGKELEAHEGAAFKQSTEAATQASDNTEALVNYVKYRSVVAPVVGVALAELSMWNCIVAAPRKRGATVAVTYSNFTTLVGPSVLAAFDDGSDTGKAAKAALESYFSDALAKAGTSEQVEKLFVESETATTTQKSAFDSYLVAATISSYLSRIMTEASFRSIYAYNRGLAQGTQELNGIPPMHTTATGIVEIAEQILTFSDTTHTAYTIRPATKNTWIWQTETVSEHNPASDLEDIDYVQNVMQWLLIATYWVLLITLVFVARRTGLW